MRVRTHTHISQEFLLAIPEKSPSAVQCTVHAPLLTMRSARMAQHSDQRNRSAHKNSVWKFQLTIPDQSHSTLPVHCARVTLDKESSEKVKSAVISANAM